MNRAFKYKIYPTAAQVEFFNKSFGCARFIYNHFLSVKNSSYEETGKSPSAMDCAKQITQMKKQPEFEWLKEPADWTLKMAINNLDRAFTNFFDKRSDHPKFKSKHSSWQTFQVYGLTLDKKSNEVIHLPKCRNVKIRMHRPVVGDIKVATVSRNPSGQYFISIIVEDGRPIPTKPAVNHETTIGVDLGIKEYAIISDGRRIQNPKHLQKSLKKLKRAQRKAAKKKKGSQNRKKANHKVAKIHQKITNQRSDFLHKLTYDLTHDNQVETICIEDLAVKNMVKNRRLSRQISDAAWGTFRLMLEYKAEWYGKNVIVISRWAPSSKLCQKCGYINDKLTLDQRYWVCPKCGTRHDRDLNAARNIKTFGLEHHYRDKSVQVTEGIRKKKTKNTAATAEIQGCGDVVSPEPAPEGEDLAHVREAASRDD